MKDISILIGGKSGDGIESVAPIIAKIFNRLGYYIYIYRDYPSLIRGGHTFAIIRASNRRIGSYKDTVDVILALNQDCIDKHNKMITKNTLVIYDSDQVKAKGCDLSLTNITKEEKAPIVTRNIGLVGAMCRVFDIDWDMAKEVISLNIPKKVRINLKIAKRAYDLAENKFKISKFKRKPLPIFTGNEAISLGLFKAGLKAYVAYPMTPASSILHFFANQAKNFGLKVVHPETEIAVILMALGFSYSGDKVAIGTSGGGFCLMTEGLSLSGMGELPVVIVMSQRAGPASGVPTYTAQADLQFVLNAGHGDFPRFVVAPGDSEEAYYWSAVSLNLSWKYQLPSIVLADKTLSEGAYSFDTRKIKRIKEENSPLWNKKGEYRRYLDVKIGVSPLAFPGDRKATVKASSYEHDEYGITTEDSNPTIFMQDKRARKMKYLEEELDKYEAVKVYGNEKSSIALLCWGSNKRICIEVAENLGIKVIQSIVFSPFPIKQFKKAIKGVRGLVSVENNSTAQLAKLVKQNGFFTDKAILKYDGRPFSVDELEAKVMRLKL